MADEPDLEAYWAEVRDQPKILAFTGRVTNLREAMELSILKTLALIGPRLQEFEVRALAGSNLGHNLEEMARTLLDEALKNWREDLRHQDPAAILELVLAGQNLPLEELKGFLRALPITLLERLVKGGSLVGKGTGIYALLAVEWHHRQHTLGRDYELKRDLDGELVVTTFPARLGGSPLSFRLDERFDINNPSGVNTEGT